MRSRFSYLMNWKSAMEVPSWLRVQSSESCTLHCPLCILTSACLREGGAELRRPLVHYVELVLLRDEVEGGEDGHEVVGGQAGLGADGAAGAGCLRAEEHLVNGPLLDRGLEEDEVIAAGVEEQVPAQVLLAEVAVGLDKAVEGAAALAAHH